MSEQVIVADADALIALALEHDPNHLPAVAISKKLLTQGETVIFPITVFPEAITSLRRAANQPDKTRLIARQLQQGAFHVEYIDEQILMRATRIFEKANSKQNTLFDAIVAATAEKLMTTSIFSFDDWYPKLGFRLAGD